MEDTVLDSVGLFMLDYLLFNSSVYVASPGCTLASVRASIPVIIE